MDFDTIFGLTFVSGIVVMAVSAWAMWPRWRRVEAGGVFSRRAGFDSRFALGVQGLVVGYLLASFAPLGMASPLQLAGLAGLQGVVLLIGAVASRRAVPVTWDDVGISGPDRSVAWPARTRTIAFADICAVRWQFGQLEIGARDGRWIFCPVSHEGHPRVLLAIGHHCPQLFDRVAREEGRS